MKKDLEILFYLSVEVALAFAFVYLAYLPPLSIAPISAVFVYFGKKLVKKIKIALKS